MKLWPEDDPKAKSASEFFVNERIDLIIREAETFRNDYRSKERKVVFNALLKPLPWAGNKPADDSHVDPMDGEIETQKYCAIILGLFIFGFGLTTIVVISNQNRRTH